MNEIIQ